MSDVPMESEYIPLFRKALATVADPVAATAATDGEIVYLGEMEICQGYLEFCDAFIASDLPAQLRERMRQLRDAMQPYLGKSVLQGGVCHAGRHYEAHIDIATSEVIHLAWSPRPPPSTGEAPPG